MYNNSTYYGDYVVNDAPIGGGGFVINWDQSTDGTEMACGHDVGSGAYIRNINQDRWYPAYNPTSVTETEAEGPDGISSDGRGSCGIKYAPSNKNIMYSLWRSRLWRSSNKGAFWNRTNAGEFFVQANSSNQPHNTQNTISIHPTDPQIVLWGTNKHASNLTVSGAFYTLDGGATAVQITGLPTTGIPNDGSAGGHHYVVIDQGNPNYCYIFVHGQGVWQSTTGVTGTFSKITGSPTACKNIIVDQNGTLWLATQNNPGPDIYKRTRAGTATNIQTASGRSVTVAVDPLNVNRIIVGHSDGVISISYDGGATWPDVYAAYNSNIICGDGEIAWLSNTGFNSSFTSVFVFDKVVPNKVWWVHGTGVSWFMVGTSAGSMPVITYHDYSNGQEEKVASCFLSIPGNPRPILGNWDYSIWPMDDLKRWKNRGIIPPKRGYGNGLMIARGLDYAADDPNFIVVGLAQSDKSNAFSADGGTSWQTIPGQTDALHYWANWIAVNRKNQIIITDTNNFGGSWTADGGITWNPIQLIPGTNTVGFANAVYVRRPNIVADKTRSAVFYLLYTMLPFPVKVTSVNDQALSGSGSFPVINTYTVQPGDKILLRVQTNTAENGVYVLTGNSSSWTFIRDKSYDTWASLSGAVVGTGYIDGAQFNFAVFKTETKTGTLGTTSINWTQDNSARNPLGGLWKTSDSGATWTQVIKGVVRDPAAHGDEDRQFWNCELKAIPGRSGELMYSPHADYTTDFLFYITNDGTTVNRIGGNVDVTNVSSFDFGPIAPGQTKPSVGFYGKVNGVFGLYLSLDWFATPPILLARFPVSNLSGCGIVGCDRNILGRVFAGGIGWTYTTYGKKALGTI